MNEITATRIANEIEIAVNGEVVDTISGKASSARPYVAVSYASKWVPEHGVIRGWVSTSHAREDLAAKARGGNAHGFHNEAGEWTPGENFVVIEVR